MPDSPPDGAGLTSEAETLAPLGTPSTGPAAPVEAVPGYDIEAELGRGGMGVVYRARQHGLGRVVALKMILAGAHAGPEAVARFRAEAEAIARLQHPGIVQVHEIGECHGLPFFSLEYCDGGSLEKLLAGSPLPAAEAARLVMDVAHAVEAAHQKGVLHRDLKPANVLLVRRTGGPPVPSAEQASRLFYEPKVTDFGLAKKLDDGGGQTRTGAIMGTPSYMAPEQAEGRKGIGPAVDVYSLGAILYECLTGRPPFKAPTPLDTILQVVNDEPVPPSQLAPRLPRDLETITLKCLHKAPEKRYATAQALADDLQAFLDGRPIAARPVSRIERAWRWCHRNRALATVGAFAVFTLLTGSVLSTMFGLAASESARQAREEAVRAFEKEEEANRAREDEARQRREVQASRVRLLVQQAQSLLAAGDPCAALPWAVEVQRLEPDEPLHALRVGRALHDLPRPSAFWTMDHAISHARFSPDGRRVAAATIEGDVRVWDEASGRLIATLPHPSTTVFAVAFSPDGKVLATASGVYFHRGAVRLWDLSTGKEIGQPIALPGSATSIGFSADGRRLIGASYTLPRGLARLNLTQGTHRAHAWDRATGKLIEEIVAPMREEPTVFTVSRYVHAPTGRVLIVEGKQARVVELGHKRGTVARWQHTAMPWYMRLSPDGRHAITLGTDGTAIVYDLHAEKEHTVALAYHWRPLDVAFPAEDEMVVAFYDGAVQRYRLSTGRAVESSFERLGFSDWAPAFSEDGAFLTALRPDGALRRWEVATWAPSCPWLPHGTQITTGDDASGGRRVLVGAADGTVRIWDLARGQGPDWTTPRVAAGPQAAISFPAPGRAAVIGHGRYALVELATGKRLEPALPEMRDGRGAAFSPDGKLLAMGTDQGQVRLLSTATGKEVRDPLEAPLPFVHHVLFSPTGEWLAARAAFLPTEPGSWMGVARVWSAASGNELTTIHLSDKKALGGVTAMAVSPDGRTLALCGGELTGAGVRGETRLVDPLTGKQRHRIRAGAGMVPSSVQFTPDGRALAVAAQVLPGGSGEVNLYDTATGKRLLGPLQPGGVFRAMTFSPDGRQLAVSSTRQVSLWDVPSGRLQVTMRPDATIEAVRFGANGRVLLGICRKTEENRGLVHLWSAATGEAIGLPIQHQPFLLTAGLSPDGRWLLAIDAQGRMPAWGLHGAAGKEERIARLARVLSGQTIRGAASANLALKDVRDDWDQLRREAPSELRPAVTVADAWHDARVGRALGRSYWACAARQIDEMASPAHNPVWLAYLAGSCYLGASDRAALERACARGLALAEKGDLSAVEPMVKLCLLLPDLSVKERALRLAARLDGEKEGGPAFAWRALARGLALYREEKWADAASWLERSRAARPQPTGCQALAQVVLAMARARQGKRSAAMELLSEADRIYAPLRGNNSNYLWLTHVHVAAMRREATRVVGR